MIVRCEECETRFRVPDDKIPPQGTLVKCSKCASTFWVTPEAPQTPAAPRKGPSSPKDSWFGTTPLEAPSPTTKAPTSKGVDPGRDSWFDVPKFTENGVQSAALSDDPFQLQQGSPFVAQGPGANMPIPADSDGPSALSLALDVMETQSGPSANVDPAPHSAQHKTSSPSSYQQTGVIDEDLAFDFEESEPSPAVQPTAATSIPATSAPSSQYQPSSPAEFGTAPRIELFLTDKKQQRRQLLYTAGPIGVRSVMLLLMFMFSVWLWSSLSRGSFSLSNLSVTAVKRVFLATDGPWALRDVHLHTIPTKNKRKRLLVIRGKLKNTDKTRHKEPDLQLKTLEARPKTLIKRTRCCALFTTLQLSRVKNKGHVKRLYRLFQSKQSYRRWIESGEQREFHIIYMLNSPIQRIELQPIAPKQTKTASL
ncbi:MAG: hypothetical protein CL920_05675 [Deltaproteobacteria bacterium]|mgnify:CR=1 FL=1|nr:hypothetical protein [Deltaproteobacteria bacterium]MBU48171.1 hypothetical protein [Deltaproteobacteria bacterium]|tara:strand:- start:11581 stop:12849 length:1269 start_codon:yes stop_codon:yes gene_type:complete